MKKSSNKNQISSKKGGAAAKVDNKKQKNNIKKTSRKLGAKGITLIVVSSILLVALIVGIVFFTLRFMQQQEEKDFDYITTDLSDYITMDQAKYKNYSINLEIAKPKAIDVDVTLLNLLALKKGAVKNNAEAQFKGTIGAGDIVNIYYRGYIKDDKGNEVVVDNMCNFGNMTSDGKKYTYSSLEIGSNKFIPGFELELAGQEFSSKNNFVRITSGTVKEGQIIYISYTRQLDGSTDSKDKISIAAERIVIADGKEKIDAKYGAGFYDTIAPLTIGATEGTTFTGTVDGKKYNYKDLKIDFATECEKEGNYILVECYFPYDYKAAPDLRNKNAFFEVYVESMVDYESKTLTNEFIEENLADEEFGVSAEDLDEFEGDRVEQIRQYIQKLLDEDYEELYKSKVEEAMWKHYHSEGVVNISKHPQAKVDSIYNEYFNDVLFQFNSSGGVIETMFGESKTCETVDEYAVIYLGLEYAENQDWRVYLRSLAENLAKERLILFHIMKTEGLLPSAEVLAERKKAVEDEYLEEYIYQYSEQYNIDKDSYTEEKWAEFEAARYKELHDYYNDSYFTEIAYYEIALDTFLTWPSVTTFDGKIQ